MSCISCLRFPGVNKTTCERLFHRRANSSTQADELFSALSTSSGDQYKGFGGCLGKGGVSDWGKQSWRGPAVGTDYGSTAGSQGAASMGDTDSCFQISASFPFLPVPSQKSTMEMKRLPTQQEVPGWGGEDIRHRGPKVLLFFFGGFYQLFPHSPQLHANIKNKHQQFCPVLLCFYIYIY